MLFNGENIPSVWGEFGRRYAVWLSHITTGSFPLNLLHRPGVLTLGFGSNDGNSISKLQSWEIRLIASVQRGSSSPCLVSGKGW